MERRNGAVFLTERKEIGKAMNFGLYPVLWMEIGKPRNGWDPFTVYEGCKANVRSPRQPDLIYNGKLTMYGDEQNEEVKTMPWKWDNLHLSRGGTFLKTDFGYRDVMEDLENANAPMLKANQEVIVVFKNSAAKGCWIRKMVTESRIDPHCSTMLTIVNPKEES